MNQNRRMLMSLLAGAGLPGLLRAAEQPSLEAVIAGPQRSPANRARDAARHPAATLQFFGLQPEHTVIELAPGGGWYTEILAPYLRQRGHLYAAHYARDDAEAYARRARAAFEAKLAADPGSYDQVQIGTMPTGASFTDIQPAGGADLVLTFRNVHNWLEAGHLDQSLAAVFKVLKPGGVFGVEDHRAAVGTAPAQMMRSGYVTEALMIDRARAAGFVLDAQSEINANPRDTKDYPKGVWTLPPTLTEGEVDRARFLAIGESDRFTHRYVKPR